MKEVEAKMPVRAKVGPRVTEALVVITYLDGRNTERKRTFKLSPKAHGIRATVSYVVEATVEFDIPMRAVEAGLAEWFQRTEGELASFVGAK